MNLACSNSKENAEKLSRGECGGIIAKATAGYMGWEIRIVDLALVCEMLLYNEHNLLSSIDRIDGINDNRSRNILQCAPASVFWLLSFNKL